MTDAGAKVIVATVPDLGLTPFARAQNTSTSDAMRSKLLSQLTDAFNSRMSVTLINDGRLIGLAYGDIETQNESKFPASFGLINVVEAACAATAPLPTCTPSTLVTNASAGGHMWADGLRLGPTPQARLGALASQRATTNTF